MGLSLLVSKQMPAEFVKKSAIAFVDGQNLFHAVLEAFGYTYPNYDVLALAKAICNHWNTQ